MKLQTKFLTIISLFFIISVMIPKSLSAQSVNFQVFYDGLDPYGQWVDDPNYGYVWIPDAGPDFMPYSTAGHWIWTDYGWTWASDYDWGWAPFHYGRWDYMDPYGWSWIPGEEWGPAWVVWRNSPGYYGWAPLTPGISIDVAIGGNYSIPAEHWCFVHDQYMGRNDIHNYYGPRGNNQTFINNSTSINNTYVDNSRHTTYISGPKREEVQKVTGREIKSVAVKENSKPGQSFKNNELNLYRPAVTKVTTEKPRPAKVVDKKDIKPVAERKPQTSMNPQPQIKKEALQPGNNTNADKINREKKQPSNEKTNQVVKPNVNRQNSGQSLPQNIKQPVQQKQQQRSVQPSVQQKQPQRISPVQRPANRNPIPNRQPVQAPRQQQVPHVEKPVGQPQMNAPIPRPQTTPVPEQQPIPQGEPRRPH